MNVPGFDAAEVQKQMDQGTEIWQKAYQASALSVT